ncbi:ABC transporter ATP-binding protein [Cognatishimia sp. MH4019]|uniref:ABC transporter ATP-binding protein n=1 Tax=Cognatishimia sp. MH4019 TaxID=2854030 RepID=UPI0021078D4C|nr:ABC transporter ATP-binding protein [Cognatishimia sp. MH4019]
MPSRWKLYVFSLACMIAVAALTAAQAYSTKLIVNDVFGSDGANSAIAVALFVIAVFATKSVALYANTVASVIFTRSVAAAYQKKVFDTLVLQDVGYFQTHSASEIAKTLMFGRAAGTIVVGISNKMLTDVLTLISLVFVMVSQSPILSSLTLILLPFIYLIISTLSGKIRELGQAELAMDGAIYSIGAETFEGIKTIKSYGIEEKSSARFTGAIDQMQGRMMQIAKLIGATVPLMELLGGISLAVFVIYAGREVAQSNVDAGAYTAFITAFLMAYQPAQRLSNIWVKLQRRIFVLAKMYAVLNPDDAAPSMADGPVPKSASLKVNRLAHYYNPRSPALKEVSFAVAPGQHTAVVGSSGAGKTTLIDLVQGFYTPESGEILLGGVDISTLSPAQRVTQIALISQDVFLFDGTIRDNIRDGRADATNAQIEDAARKATVLDFADTLPDGLDTEIGPNGSNLSGGQKQRVGIARALIKPAKVFIYDEATSALDGETEQRVMQAIRETTPDSVVLFVTHRASTLEWMDKVLVLDEGRVVAFDTVDKVRASSDHFKAIFAPAPAA